MSYELGIIGGMGPLATDVFYEYIIRHTEASCDQEHIDIVLLNHASMPDRTQAILTGREEEFLQAVQRDFDLLNTVPLKAVVIPCNTSHYFYDSMTAMSRAPIINMIEECMLACKAAGHDSIVVFGTQGTLRSGLYERYAQKHGLNSVCVSEEDREKIMEIIYDVKATNRTESEALQELIQKYSARGKVILACTELSVLAPADGSVVDALKVLAERAIERCGRSVKK